MISVSYASTDKLFEYLTNEKNHENLLIFANGYRINTADLFGSKNIVKNWKTFFNTDYTNQENIRFHDYYAESGEYWEDIDDIFIDHIGTQNAIYADGHDSILTSNHKNTLTFDPQGEKDIKKSKLSLAIGFASTLATRGKRVQHALYKTAIGTISSQAYNAIPGYDSSCKNNPGCLVLDYNSNIDGFNDRYLNGFAYGVKVYNNIQNNNIKVAKDEMGKVTGKIDIVAHSMGYAYAAGILDALIDLKVLAEGNKFGGFYIIAPENAPVKNINDILEKTDYVWQYGTAEVGSPNPNLLHHQDGIAPQVAVPGLTFSSGNLTKGRIKYAGELSKAGFGLHHLSSSYDWIINLNEQNQGYVQPRY